MIKRFVASFNSISLHISLLWDVFVALILLCCLYMKNTTQKNIIKMCVRIFLIDMGRVWKQCTTFVAQLHRYQLRKRSENRREMMKVIDVEQVYLGYAVHWAHWETGIRPAHRNRNGNRGKKGRRRGEVWWDRVWVMEKEKESRHVEGLMKRRYKGDSKCEAADMHSWVCK